MSVIVDGYCVFIKDFYAYVVRFKTLSVLYSENTVSIYEIELENGEIEERNETELVFSKDELEEKVIKINKSMKKAREYLRKQKLTDLKSANT